MVLEFLEQSNSDGVLVPSPVTSKSLESLLSSTRDALVDVDRLADGTDVMILPLHTSGNMLLMLKLLL